MKRKAPPSGRYAAQAGGAIELELFTNRFMAIADEMGEQLRRTAFSVNVKERLDFSCALLDHEAELLVGGTDRLISRGCCLGQQQIVEGIALKRGR